MIRVVLAGVLASVGGCAVTMPTTVESPGPESGCRIVERVVIVRLDPVDHARVLDHVNDAVRDGHPAILTIERDGADARRDAATDDYPTRDGFDRDEWPVAMSEQGGEGSSVRHVPSSENRSAGAIMGHWLEDYCDGQSFRVRPDGR